MMTPVTRETRDIPSILASSRRVLVIGCPGGGKTTFAHRLSTLTGVPVVSLDDYYFGPGWRPAEPETWYEMVRQLSAAPEWIMDGNHASSLSERLARAEAVVLLDRHPSLCLARYVWRLIGYAKLDEEMLPHYMRLGDGRRKTAENPLLFARFILLFRRKTMPTIRACLQTRPSVPVAWVRTRRDASALLSRLAETTRRGDDTC